MNSSFNTLIDRRSLLAHLGTTIGAAASLLSVPGGVRLVQADSASEFPLDYKSLDAISQAELLRSGKVTPALLTDIAISRIQALNPAINAVVTPLYEPARTRANTHRLPQGPFQGVPYLLKDLINLKGARTTYGSRAMINNIAKENHIFVDAMQQAGVNILGKTNTPEFGLVTTTEPTLFGACKNPWNLLHSAGGSSGGAAAAVAAGMVAIAQASDGGGSIRMPASNCGVFGLKPSRGRNVSRGGGLNGLAVKGHISRSVRDSAALFAITERKDTNARYTPVGYVSGASPRRLKIALMMNNHFDLPPDKDVEEAILKTAKLCESLGHSIEPNSLALDGEKLMDHFFVLWSNWPGKVVGRFSKTIGREPSTDDFEPWTLYLANYYRRISKALLQKTPPSFEDNETTDKGYLNQRGILVNRADEVAKLYHDNDQVSDDIITIS